jgi:hypothetical protein
MKKIKWIMLALVLCLGLVGGAYAAWSDSLFIQAEINTAEIYMMLKDATIVSEGSGEEWVNGFSVIDTGRSSDTLNIELSNMYPKVDYNSNSNSDDYIILKATIMSDGSLPTKLDNVTVTNITGSAQKLKFYFNNTVYDGPAAFAAGLENYLSTLTWDDNDETDIEFVVWLNGETGNEFQAMFGEFNITFNFKQYNM